MKLSELIRQPELLETDFSQYSRHAPSHMPPLELAQLHIRGVLNGAVDMPTEGGNTLLVEYKGKGGGVVSAAEQEDGRTWNVLQVQGSKSRKSYRVTSCLEWQRCLGDKYRELSECEAAEVERITMPDIFRITNITDAGNFEGAQRSYAIVRQALQLRHSEQEQQWVRDIVRSKAHEILSPHTINTVTDSL